MLLNKNRKIGKSIDKPIYILCRRRSIYYKRSSSVDFYSKSGSKTVKIMPLKAVKITFFRRFLAYC